MTPGATPWRPLPLPPEFDTPNPEKLGFFNIDGVTCGEKEPAPTGPYARMAEKARARDTTIGHWGDRRDGRPSLQLPTYPDGFPLRSSKSLSGALAEGPSATSLTPAPN